MNLNQAIQSGYAFRRPNWRKNYHGRYSWVEKNGKNFRFKDGCNAWSPHAEDITANDFIVDGPKEHVFYNQATDELFTAVYIGELC